MWTFMWLYKLKLMDDLEIWQVVNRENTFWFMKKSHGHYTFFFCWPVICFPLQPSCNILILVIFRWLHSYYIVISIVISLLYQPLYHCYINHFILFFFSIINYHSTVNLSMKKSPHSWIKRYVMYIIIRFY